MDFFTVLSGEIRTQLATLTDSLTQSLTSCNSFFQDLILWWEMYSPQSLDLCVPEECQDPQRVKGLGRPPEDRAGAGPVCGLESYLGLVEEGACGGAVNALGLAKVQALTSSSAQAGSSWNTWTRGSGRTEDPESSFPALWGTLLSPSHPQRDAPRRKLTPVGEGQVTGLPLELDRHKMLLALPSKDLIYLLQETALSC